MEKVVIIKKEDRDVHEMKLVGVASDFDKAVDFLVDKDLLDEDYCVFHNWEEHVTIKKNLGAQWKEKVKEMGLEKFNNYFHGTFKLEVHDVY